MRLHILIALLMAFAVQGFSQAYKAAGTATTDAPVSGSIFAQPLALSGNEAVFSAFNDDGSKGQVFFSSKTGSTWTTVKLAPAGLVANDQFSRALAIFGQDAAVSTTSATSPLNTKGNIYIYSKSSGSWAQTQKISPPWQAASSNYFAYSLAMDKNLLVAGALDYDSLTSNSGAVYVYEKVNGTWVYRAILRPPGLAASANFGNKVFVRNNAIVVSSPYENSYGGAMYVYRKVGGSWVLSQKLTPNNTPDETYFGLYANISDNTLAITAYSATNKQGVVYMYRDNGSTYQLTNKLVPPVVNNTLSFGASGIAFSGNTGILGCFGNNNNEGNFYALSFDGSKWNIGSEITLPGIPAGSMQKGRAGTMAFNGENLIVTCPIETVGGILNVGRAYFYESPASFVASDTASDAFVNISWNKALGCAHHLSKPVFAQLYDVTNGVEVQSTIIDSIFKYDAYEGSYKRFVKPGQLARYELRFYEYGPGTPVCTTAADTGKTLAYIKPKITGSSSVHGSNFSIDNKSDYSTNINVYRNGKLLQTISSKATEFNDVFKFGDASSIENGKAYTYCFQNINSSNGDTTAKVCVVEKTVPLNLSLTNERFNANGAATSVKLKWDDIREYASSIKIERDNILLGIFDNNTTSYEDKFITPGKAHVYSFVVNLGGSEVYRRQDTGSIRANGRLYGRITNNDKGFGLSNTTVTVSAVIDGKTYTYSAKTSATGVYEIKNIYYNTGADYKVTLKRGNIAFDNNNSTVTLNLANPVLKLDFKSNYSVNSQQTQSFTVSNFKITASDTSDLLKLSWDHTQTDTVYYKITRNGEILDILTASASGSRSYENNTGEPGLEYTYVLTAYTLKGNKYFEQVLTQKNTFPLLAAPEGFKVSLSPQEVLLLTSWNTSSQNRDGIEIFRNGKLVYTAGNNQVSSWKDYTGYNDTFYTYKIRSYKYLQPGNKIVSDFVSASKYYPGMLTASTVKIDTLSIDLSYLALPKEDYALKISWVFSMPYHQASNTDGFVIQRSNGSKWDSIGFVSKYSPLEFTDMTGIPDAAYKYRVVGYKRNQRSESAAIAFDATYPSLPQPYRVFAQGGEGYVRLDWDKVASPVSGYAVVRGTDTLFATPEMHYTTYVVPGNYNTTPMSFSFYTYKIINGKKYFSAPKTISGASLAYGGGTQQAPSQFKASQNYTNHVKLTWSYPSYIVPTFMIYRDGIFIDSVNGLQRTYYDYKAMSNNLYAYQVAAKYGSNTSRRVGANGKRSCAYIISGRVASAISRKGIPNAQVSLLVKYKNYASPVPFYQYTAVTDLNGSYSIPLNVDTLYFNLCTYNVSVLENNISVPLKNVSVYPVISKFDYTVDFYDTLDSHDAVPDTIALPKQFTAKADKRLQRTILSWATDNPNYSGFKVFRGMGEIANVEKGQSMVTIDGKGEPGYQYNYRIQAYWTVNGITRTSEFVNTYEVFPKLAAVEDLSAGSFNNYVKLQWSHESDLHSYYEVKRNAAVIGLTLTGGQMVFVDSTGLPGQQYKYTVTPVLVNDLGTFRGAETSVSTVYPVVSKADKLALTVAKNGITVSWNNPSDLVSTFKIYRDAELIATLKNNGFASQSYTDFGGVPNRLHEYAVSCTYKRNGVDFVSSRVNDFKTFPVLEKADTFTATPVANEDRVRLRWVYKYKGADYFEVARQDINSGKVVIKNIEAKNTGGNDVYIFDDITGVPANIYNYTIEAKTLRASATYVSGTVSAGATLYPSLSTPVNVVASQTKANYIELYWEHKSPTVTSFTIYRDGVNIGTVDGKTRHFVDINQADMNNCNIYYVTAAKTFPSPYGNKVSGNSASVEGTSVSKKEMKGILQTCAVNYSYFGTSVDFDGTRAIVGAPSQSGSLVSCVYIYSYSGGIWKLDQVIKDPGNTATGGFGKSVAISGNRCLVGCPNTGNGGAYMFEYNTTTKLWSQTFSWGSSSAGEMLGFSVDIKDDHMILGAPGRSSNSGGVLGFYWNGSSWINFINNSGTGGEQMGYSVSIGGIFNGFAYSAPMNNSKRGVVYAGTVTGLSTISAIKTLTSPSAVSNNEFGSFVDVSGSSLIVGERFGDGALGTTWYYNDLWQSTPAAEEVYNTGTGNNATDEFGYCVRLSGGKVLIGARGHNAGGTDNGSAYLYQKVSGVWTMEKQFIAPAVQAGQQFGAALAFNNGQVLIAAPQKNLGGSGQGIIYHYNQVGGNWISSAYRSEITAVTASDGAYPNQTLIEWTFTGTPSLVKEFLVYRDGQLISSEANSKSKFFDKEGVPGKKHVYAVKASYTDGTETYAKSDIGYRLGNGKIEGTVVTFNGGYPVNGATVKASATIDGDIIEYTTTSDVSGSYKFTEVYYGEKANYTVTVAYPNHFFDTDTLKDELNLTENSAFLQPFRDKTAFLIQGNVAMKDMSCGLDSIKLRLDIYTKNGVSAMETNTNAAGNYSFVIDPLNPQILKYVLKINNEQGEQAGSASKYHQFDMDSVIYANLAALSSTTVTTKNIKDTLGYNVKVSVAGSCGILGTYRYNLLVKSDDGCYEKTLLTSDAGIANMKLPPVNVQVSVLSVVPNNSNTIPITDYFKVRPHFVTLGDMHKDSLMTKVKSGTAIKVIREDFIYHKSPVINIAGVTKYFCNNPQYPMVFDQGTQYSLNLDATETFGSTSCSVNEGYIIVRNDGADSPVVRLDYNAKKGSFPDYVFKAGTPAIIEPYQKYLIVEYHTVSDGMLAELIKPMVILGTAQQPGNDILVKNNGDGVQMPLSVLRDPPGDGSYSFVEANTSFTRALTMSDENTGFAGVNGQQNFKFFGIGAEIVGSFKGGGGTARNAEMEVTYTTTKRITTPDRSGIDNSDLTGFLIGDQGDVIVGAGVSMKYGMSDQVYLDGDCQLMKKSIITVSPNGVNTTWVYTVSQIEKIIKDLNFTLNDDNQIALQYGDLTPAQGKQKITAMRDNWVNVLEYHRKASVPFIQLCDVNNYSSLPEPFKTQAINWVANGFCAEVGTYSTIGGKRVFTMKDNVAWSNDLIEKYKKVNQAVRDLSDDGYQANFPAGRDFSQSRLDDINIDAEYTSQYGVDAENYTFSGGTSIENSVSIEKSKSRSYIQKTFFESELYAGLLAGNKIEMLTGGGLGAIFLTGTPEAVDVENKIGITAGYNFSFEQNTTNTQSSGNTVGYKLTDNDVGDQFSVTVIRGIDPSHTPYFALTGGRSSCPNEPGTIPRDQASIMLETPDKTGFNKVQQGIDADVVVAYPVKLMNLAPSLFNESRGFQLSLSENANQYGAKVVSQGTTLGETSFKINSGSYVYTNVYVTRAPGFYDFPDITLNLAPTCPENSVSYDGAEMNLEVYYRRPCSNISIVEPGNNWTIRKAVPKALNDPDEKMTIYLADYDLQNIPLESVTLEYRRIGDSKGWISMGKLTKKQLQDYYDQNKSTYRLPKYPFVWDIKGKTDILDGNYEIRAYNTCGLEGFNYSNVISGKIDRSTIVLYGTPEPSDGIYSLGDPDISVTFNKEVECGSISTGNYTFIRKRDSSVVNMTHSCFGNKIIFSFTDPISALDGEIIVANLKDVADKSGNKQAAPVIWEFEISNNPVYWLPHSITLDVYRGAKTTAPANLFNTSSSNRSFTLAAKNSSWLSAKAPFNFVPSVGVPVTITVNTAGLPLGTYVDTMIADVAGFTKEYLTVTINVVAQPPVWTAKTYESNATVICNFELDSSGVLSKDTMDRIAAVIGNEIRGVANIVKSGNYYRAYIPVSGNSNDIGENIDFRIWDASSGKEYDGHPRASMTFAVNAAYGTTIAPQILDVNTDRDSVRYIPLKKGWNWLAINTSPVSLNVNDVLKSLKSANGDIIKTQTGSASYSESSRRWIYLTGGVSQVSPENGYLLNISKDDTLRLGGTDAIGTTTILNKGWNLVGNITQKAQSIGDVYSFQNLSDKAILKNDVQVAEYDSASKTWNGFTNIIPNKSYLLRNGKFGSLTKRGAIDSICSQFDPSGYEKNMNIFAVVKIDGTEMTNNTDKVRALVNGECRGEATLEYNAVLNRYVMALTVYHTTDNDTLSFKIIRANGQEYLVKFKEIFVQNKTLGMPDQPYIITKDDKNYNGISSRTITELSAKVYPNPFEKHITVSVSAGYEETANIAVYDLNGRQLVQTEKQLSAGENIILLQHGFDTLPAGIYILQVNTPSGNFRQKLIKM